jgi:agmatinase
MTSEKTSRNTPDRMSMPFVGMATFGRQPEYPHRDRRNGIIWAVARPAAQPPHDHSSKHTA